MEYTFKLPNTKEDQTIKTKLNENTNKYEIEYIYFTNKPINCIEDFKNHLVRYTEIICKYVDCDKVIKLIEDKNIYNTLFNTLTTDINKVFYGIHPTEKFRYEDIYNQGLEEFKKHHNLSCRWIYANQDKVFEFIETEKKRICDEYKAQKKIANKKFYNLNKEPTERILLTEEEKKENKRKSNEAYYLKQKTNKIETPKVLLTQEEKKNNKKKANEIYYLKKKNNKFLEKVFEIVEPNETKINFEIEENYIEIVGTQKKVITLPKESSKLTEEEAKEKQKQRSKEQYLKLKELKNIPNKSDVLSKEQKAVNKKLSQQKWKQKQKLKIIVEPVIPLVL